MELTAKTELDGEKWSVSNVPQKSDQAQVKSQILYTVNQTHITESKTYVSDDHTVLFNVIISITVYL